MNETRGHFIERRGIVPHVDQVVKHVPDISVTIVMGILHAFLSL